MRSLLEFPAPPKHTNTLKKLANEALNSIVVSKCAVNRLHCVMQIGAAQLIKLQRQRLTLCHCKKAATELNEKM